MSDLSFSSPELYQFSTDTGAITVPTLDGDTGADLRGTVLGSAQAADTYGKVAVAAQFYLDRARRGLLAFQQLSRDIAQKFDGQDRVNADAFKNAWTPEYQALRGHRGDETAPAVAPKPGSSVIDQLIQQLQGGPR